MNSSKRMLQRNRPENIAATNHRSTSPALVAESGNRLGDESLQVEYIRDLTYPTAAQHAVAVVEYDGLAGGDAELGGVEFDV